MKIPRGIIIGVALIAGLLGWFWLQDGLTKPMGTQVMEAGYSAEDLSNLTCGDRGNNYDCTSLLRTDEDPVGLDSDEVVSLVYRPKGAPAHCEYKFTKTFSPLGASWVFALDRGQPALPLGAKSYNNGALWDGNTATIEKPEPGALWQFAKDRLTGIDEACKPTNA